MSGQDAHVTFRLHIRSKIFSISEDLKRPKLRGSNFSWGVINALYSLEKLVKNNPIHCYVNFTKGTYKKPI